MKKFLFFLLLLGCSTTVTPEARTLEGTWRASGTLDDGGFSWYTEYTFQDGSYTMSGYPPISAQGTYTATENTLTLNVDDGNVYNLPYDFIDDGQTLEISGTSYDFVK